MQNSPSSGTTWHYRLLWLFAILSLLFNAILVAGMLVFRAQAQQEAENIAQALDTVSFDNFEFPVVVDQTIPISLSVPFNQLFEVPISKTLPISLSVPFTDTFIVPIEHIIPINTTVNVPINIPGIGAANLPIPINTSVPISLTVEVPVSKTVAINTDIPVVLDIEVPIRTEVPIQSDIPIALNIPVEVPLDQLGINPLLTQVKDFANLLAQALDAGSTTTIIMAIFSTIFAIFVLLNIGPAARTGGRAMTQFIDRVTSRRVPSAPRAYLVVMEGDTNIGRTLELYGDTPLGNSRQFAELLFQQNSDDSAVSRLHCTVLDLENHFKIKDEDSANGTYLNGTRLEPLNEARLEDGDMIELGQVERGGVRLMFQVAGRGQTEIPDSARLTNPSFNAADTLIQPAPDDDF